MATGGLTPLRENLVYIGWSKQAAWHTPLAPTSFWRWLDGSMADDEIKMTTAREGDTSPHVSLAFKNAQYATAKIVEYLRPRTAGCALQALLGTGSDAYTPPTFATTLAAAIVAGATTFQSTANLGNVGTLALNFTPGVAVQNYEVATADLTTRTGTGPWTYTLATAATFKQAHGNGDALTTVSTHTFTRGLSTFDPYTIEIGRGDGVNAPFQVVRLVDAICYDLTITSAKGSGVKLEHSWYGAYEQLQNVFATPVYEGLSVVGATGGPIAHYQALGNWKIDGVNAGNALTIENLTIKAKNTTNVEEFVSEGIQPDFFTLDNFDVSATAQVIFQNFNQYYEMYFGNTQTPAATARDSYLVGYGTFLTTWTEDAINALTASLPNVAYTAGKLPFKLDAKPVRQSIAMTGIKSPSFLNPLILTLTNSQNSQY